MTFPGNGSVVAVIGGMYLTNHLGAGRGRGLQLRLAADGRAGQRDQPASADSEHGGVRQLHLQRHGDGQRRGRGDLPERPGHARPGRGLRDRGRGDGAGRGRGDGVRPGDQRHGLRWAGCHCRAGGAVLERGLALCQGQWGG